MPSTRDVIIGGALPLQALIALIFACLLAMAASHIDWVWFRVRALIDTSNSGPIVEDDDVDLVSR